MSHPFDFQGQVVVVTGGARGIGRGIAEAFLEANANVVVCGRNKPATLPQSGEKTAVFATADVRVPEAVEAMFEDIVRERGRVDVLVNNAGGAPVSEAATASSRFSEKVTQLNLLAALHTSQHANRIMQEQASGGVIINIASVSGIRPSPWTSMYGAAKAGLISLTTSLAIEWAPKVRVNAISAGMIRTEQSHLHYGDDDAVARVARTVPLGRLGTPRDVANACLYLASPLASYVSGANLVVHGGGETPAFLAAAQPKREG